ncbi:unnamed protein product [Brassica napus]|uniref:(rape) hypothetical protein n=1 Tax=Brassica napus TaxID=3708 RepID=A0A817AEN2_BRANA|nr:unnamed protein product [Brassica napus]
MRSLDMDHMTLCWFVVLLAYRLAVMLLIKDREMNFLLF